MSKESCGPQNVDILKNGAYVTKEKKRQRNIRLTEMQLEIMKKNTRISN